MAHVMYVPAPPSYGCGPLACVGLLSLARSLTSQLKSSGHAFGREQGATRQFTVRCPLGQMGPFVGAGFGGGGGGASLELGMHAAEQLPQLFSTHVVLAVHLWSRHCME
jgi:hypothetical protein